MIRSLCFFLMFSGMMLWVSCEDAIYFDQPQPIEGKSYEEFPASLRGVFTNEDIRIAVTSDSFTYIIADSVDISGNFTSGNMILKKVGKTYLLNLKTPDGPDAWSIYPFEVMEEQLRIYYFDAEKWPMIDSLPLGLIRPEEQGHSYYLASPEKKEFKTWLRERISWDSTSFLRQRME